MWRRNLNFGATHKEKTHGNNERFARVRRSFRTPNTQMESEDEKIHFRREKRYLHHRSTKNYPLLPLHLKYRTRRGCRGQDDTFRRHQKTSRRDAKRVCREVRHALCEPQMARRHANEFFHYQAIDPQTRSNRDYGRGRLDKFTNQKRGANASPQKREARALSRRHSQYERLTGYDLRHRRCKRKDRRSGS